MRAERERNKNCASTGTPLHNSLPPFGTVIPKPPLRRATILPISGKSDECQTSHRPTRKSKSSQLDLYKIKNGKLCQFTQCCVSRSDSISFAPFCENRIVSTQHIARLLSVKTESFPLSTHSALRQLLWAPPDFL